MIKELCCRCGDVPGPYTSYSGKVNIGIGALLGEVPVVHRFLHKGSRNRTEWFLRMNKRRCYLQREQGKNNRILHVAQTIVASEVLGRPGSLACTYSNEIVPLPLLLKVLVAVYCRSTASLPNRRKLISGCGRACFDRAGRCGVGCFPIGMRMVPDSIFE